jgi:hypothetical protein
MTDPSKPIQRLYLLTAAFGLLGAIFCLARFGTRESFAFLMGALASLGNLWVYDYMSRGIAPGTDPKKPWQASAFISRYLLLVAGGYALVKVLGVNPLTVILGLLASTAAVLASSILELIQSFFERDTR